MFKLYLILMGTPWKTLQGLNGLLSQGNRQEEQGKGCWKRVATESESKMSRLIQQKRFLTEEKITGGTVSRANKRDASQMRCVTKYKLGSTEHRGQRQTETRTMGRGRTRENDMNGASSFCVCVCETATKAD